MKKYTPTVGFELKTSSRQTEALAITSLHSLMKLMSTHVLCTSATRTVATSKNNVQCVQRAPVCEVSSRPYLFAYCLNAYKTMHYVRFRPLNLNVALRNRTKCIVW